MVDENILNEILNDIADRPTMYHITVESSEDGIILDAEVPSLLFIIDKGDDESGELTTMQSRGLTRYELWGWLAWAVESHKEYMMSNNAQGPPLVDESEPDAS